MEGNIVLGKHTVVKCALVDCMNLGKRMAIRQAVAVYIVLGKRIVETFSSHYPSSQSPISIALLLCDA